VKKAIIIVGIISVFVFFYWFYLNNFTFNRFTGLSYSEAFECLKRTKEDSIAQGLRYLTLVKDEKTAIAIVEPMLFSLYGKETIKMERPYQISLIKGYWVIVGTFPKIYEITGASGGTFEVIMNSKNGAITSICHYK